ncbi:hypothetical protein V7056_06035, partial [Bacillus sp. JJ664]
VNLENFTVTGAKSIPMTGPGAGNTDYGHGINVVSSSDVTLNNITSTNNAAAGLIVNSSTVNADNLNTSGNIWYGVNVDKKDSVDAIFTLTGSGVLSEVVQIFSDNTTGATVVAEGYESSPFGTTKSTIWSNR